MPPKGGAGFGDINVPITFQLMGMQQAISGINKVQGAAEKGMNRSAKSASFLTRTMSSAFGYATGRAIYSTIRAIEQIPVSVQQAIGDYERLDRVIRIGVAREKQSAELAKGNVISLREAYDGLTVSTADYLNNVQNIALTRPVSEADLADTFRTLSGYQFTVKASMAFTEALADFAMATGRTSDETYRLSLALGQIKAKGKLAGEEMRQLTNAGITMDLVLAGLNNLYPELNINAGNFYDEMRAGNLKSKFILPAILSQLQEFEGLGKEMGKTWAGIPDMLYNISRVINRNLFGGLFEQIAKPIISFIELFDQSMNPNTVEGIKAIGDAIGDYVKPQFEWIDAFAIPAIGRFMNGLRAGTGVGSKFLSGIASVLEWGAKDWQPLEFAGEAVNRLSQEIADMFDSAARSTPETINWLVTTIDTMISQAKERVPELGAAFWSWLGETSADIYGRIASIIPSVKSGMVALAVEIYGRAQVVGDTFWSWVSSVDPTLVLQSIGDTAGYLTSSFNSEILPVVTEFANQAWEWAKTKPAEIYGFGQSAYEYLRSEWEAKVIPQLSTWGDELWNGITSTEFRGDLTSFFSTIDSAMASTLGTTPGLLTEAGNAFVDAFIDAAGEGAGSADYESFFNAYIDGMKRFSENEKFKISMEDVGRAIYKNILAPPEDDAVAETFLIRVASGIETVALTSSAPWGIISRGIAYMTTGGVKEGFKDVKKDEVSAEGAKVLEDILTYAVDRAIAFIIPVYNIKMAVDFFGGVGRALEDPNKFLGDAAASINAWGEWFDMFVSGLGVYGFVDKLKQAIWGDFNLEVWLRGQINAMAGIPTTASAGGPGGGGGFGDLPDTLDEVSQKMSVDIPKATDAANGAFRNILVQTPLEAHSPSLIEQVLSNIIAMLSVGIPRASAIAKAAFMGMTPVVNTLGAITGAGAGGPWSMAPAGTPWGTTSVLGGISTGGVGLPGTAQTLGDLFSGMFPDDLDDAAGKMQDAAVKMQTAVDKFSEGIGNLIGFQSPESYGVDYSYMSMHMPADYAQQIGFFDTVGEGGDKYLRQISDILAPKGDAVNKDSPFFQSIMGMVEGTKFEIPPEIIDKGGAELRASIMAIADAAVKGDPELVEKGFINVDGIIQSFDQNLKENENWTLAQQSVATKLAEVFGPNVLLDSIFGPGGADKLAGDGISFDTLITGLGVPEDPANNKMSQAFIDTENTIKSVMGDNSPGRKDVTGFVDHSQREHDRMKDRWGETIEFDIIGHISMSGGGGGGGGAGGGGIHVNRPTNIPGFSPPGSRSGFLGRVFGAGSGDTVPFMSMLEPGEVIQVIPKREVLRPGGQPGRSLVINIGSVNNGHDEAWLEHKVREWAFT